MFPSVPHGTAQPSVTRTDCLEKVFTDYADVLITATGILNKW